MTRAEPSSQARNPDDIPLPVAGSGRHPGRGPAIEPDLLPTRPPLPAGPYLVLGLGRAGLAACEALMARFGAAAIRAWDDSRGVAARSARASLAETGITLVTDPTTALDGVGAVVKSPGITFDHELLSAAREREIPVLDELEMAWRMTSHPVVAVTGTNGKSTTAAFVAAALGAAGADPVLAGNLHDGPPLSAVPAKHNGWVVAEVAGYQAEGCPEFMPSVAVLTNLTPEHLHRFGSMTAYAAAKRRFFVRGSRAVPIAVLNIDDPFGRRLASEVRDRGGRVVTYAREREADYRIRGCTWSARHGVAELETRAGAVQVETRLPGLHNAANAAAALATANSLGLEPEPTLDALADMAPLPARFEPIDAGQPFEVVVDFAHSPDGVDQALVTARGVVAPRGGRVIVVFGLGAGGHRGIWEQNGSAARAGSDHLVLCAVSQKGEPPLLALAGLLAGARAAKGGTLEVVLDRRAAIGRGLACARPGDLVAILGRGPLVRTADDRHHGPGILDDREVVRELLEAQRLAAQAASGA